LELLFFNKIEKFVVDGRRVEGTSKDKRSTSYLLRSSGKISFEPIEFGGNCSEQVCQMLYQYWAKNTNLVFLEGLRMENGLLECFTTIWHIVWRVGIFCGDLVYVSRFGIFCGDLVHVSRFGIFGGDLVHVSRFGIFCGDLVYLCFPFWYTYCTKKNLATLVANEKSLPSHEP
jgi:hypothetical protein